MVERGWRWRCIWLSPMFLGIAVALGLPPAYGPDLITPVLFTSFGQAQVAHLIYGNLILGVLEAGLLIAAFGTPKVKTAALMVVANYASACAYFPASRLVGRPLRPEHLPAAFPIAFVLTVAVEAPFVRWCFRESRRASKRWIAALLVAQVVSYALLAVFYAVHARIFYDIRIPLPLVS